MAARAPLLQVLAMPLLFVLLLAGRAQGRAALNVAVAPAASAAADAPRIYDTCELARELVFRLDVPQEQVATWVCIAFHESRFDTSAVGRLSGASLDHGLFQISDQFWCGRSGAGGGCALPCAALRDADIADDVACARAIHAEHTRLSGDGFNAWAVYTRGDCTPARTPAFVRGCFDEEQREEETKPVRPAAGVRTEDPAPPLRAPAPLGFGPGLRTTERPGSPGSALGLRTADPASPTADRATPLGFGPGLRTTDRPGSFSSATGLRTADPASPLQSPKASPTTNHAAPLGFGPGLRTTERPGSFSSAPGLRTTDSASPSADRAAALGFGPGLRATERPVFLDSAPAFRTTERSGSLGSAPGLRTTDRPNQFVTRVPPLNSPSGLRTTAFDSVSGLRTTNRPAPFNPATGLRTTTHSPLQINHSTTVARTTDHVSPATSRLNPLIATTAASAAAAQSRS